MKVRRERGSQAGSYPEVSRRHQLAQPTRPHRDGAVDRIAISDQLAVVPGERPHVLWHEHGDLAPVPQASRVFAGTNERR